MGKTGSKLSNEECTPYTGLVSQFVEFFATLWFYHRIRGKSSVTALSTARSRRFSTEQGH